jgi:mannose-1-phosphate guanylyltransferase
MKAMLLAAGKGTRVRPLTLYTPKPMLTVLGRPVLELLIEHLVRNGVDEIAINLSHLPEIIQLGIGDGGRFGARIAYSFEGRMSGGKFIGEAVGSAGGMRQVQDAGGMFDDTFVVLCADALIDLDLAPIVARHKARGALATVVLAEVPRSEVGKYGVAQTAADGRVLRFQEKPHPDEAVSTRINTGIYLFEPAIFDLIPGNGAFDIGSQLLPMLAERGLPFYGDCATFQWTDIGSVGDWWHANRLAVQGRISGLALPGREVAPGVRVGANVRIDLARTIVEGPVYIGSGSVVQPGAVIVGPTVIGANCAIESGAIVEDSVIDAFSRVSGQARLRGKVLSGSSLVEPDGFFVNLPDCDLDWLLDDVRRERRHWETHAEIAAFAPEGALRVA